MKYLLVLVLLLVGCTQAVAPSVSQSAQPTPSTATPTAEPTCAPMGGTPYPCSAEEYQRIQEQNQLTEEAIALYRRWTKESTRLYRAGGTSKPTPEMLAIMAGDALKSGLGIFQDLKAAQARAVSGEVEIVRIGPDPSRQVQPGSVAIVACMDGRSLKFESKGKRVSSGALYMEYVTSAPVDGKLRMVSAASEGVKSCQS